MTAAFSKDVQGATISFVLVNGTTSIPATVSYDPNTGIVTLQPSSSLAYGTTYTAILSGVQDVAGEVMASPVSWTFTTLIPPMVMSTTPASGATAIPLESTVTARFSEQVQPSTISFVLTDASGNLLGATVTYDASSHTATLTPISPMAYSTVYTATISGAVDQSGIAMPGSYSWSFTSATGAWTQATAADFSAGTQSDTTVDTTAGGVTLASSVSEDFSEGLFSSAWTTYSWTTAGGGPTSVTLSDSVLSVGGAEVLSTTLIPDGVGVEGSVNFAPAPYQHFGMATDLTTVSGNSWAIFSTGGTNDTLFARVNAAGTTQDVNLGALPSGFHDYKIQPVAGGIQFSVDGVALATINLTIPSGTPLAIAMSSFNGCATASIAS